MQVDAGRNEGLDQARAIACIMVVAVHASSKFMDAPGVEGYVAALVMSASKVCVPIFVMLSGYLLLGTIRTSALDFYRKAARKMALPVLIWSVIYVCLRALDTQLPSLLTSKDTIRGIIASSLNGKPFYHLWYMFMLVGLYAALPILSRGWATLDRSEKKTLTALALAAAVISGLYGIIFQRGPWWGYNFVPWLGFLFVGALLREERIGGRHLPNLYVLGVMLAAIGTVLLPEPFGHGYSNKYFSPGIMLASVAAFAWLSSRPSRPLHPSASFVATHSFQAYLAHTLVLELAYSTMVHLGATNGLVVMPVLILVSLTGALAISAGLSRLSLPPAIRTGRRSSYR